MAEVWVPSIDNSKALTNKHESDYAEYIISTSNFTSKEIIHITKKVKHRLYYLNKLGNKKHSDSELLKSSIMNFQCIQNKISKYPIIVNKRYIYNVNKKYNTSNEWDVWGDRIYKSGFNDKDPHFIKIKDCALKEKLLINKETTSQLNWLHKLAIFSNQGNVKYIISSKKKFSNFKINYLQAELSHKLYKHYKPSDNQKYEIFKSKLNHNIDTLPHESIVEIPFSITDSQISNFNNQISQSINNRTCNIVNFKLLIKPHVSLKGSKQNLQIKDNEPRWNLYEKNIYNIEVELHQKIPLVNETWFDRCFAQLCDSQFNKLSFYKFKIPPSQEQYRKDFKIEQCFDKQYWLLTKNILKKLVWNPVKIYLKTTDYTIHDIMNNESMVFETKFSVKTKSLICHKKIKNNSLDLIDVDKRKFGIVDLYMVDTSNASIKESPVPNIPTKIIAKNTSQLEASTELNINTSIIPQKRSFLDCDLQSLIASKKTTKSLVTGSKLSKNISLLKFLDRNSTQPLENNKEVSEVRDNSFEEDKVKSTMKLTRVSCQKIKGRHVILNTKHLKSNFSVTNLLVKQFQIQVVERQFELDFDFILNETTSIIRLNIENFFQVLKNGKLYYQEALENLKSEFKTIIVIIEYNELLEETDKDIFWKIHLYFNIPQFEVIIVKQNNIEICQMIVQAVSKYSTRLPESTIAQYFNEQNKNMSIEILISLKFNDFLILKCLEHSSIYELLYNVGTKDNKYMELTNIMTDSQLMRLQKLLQLSW
ncbi:hypothetical protein TPHA_0A06030 [Tetrapisispora phaffii CBS 4417]|uniref:Uncharacterized protein n=1 Tax=Tetrapisispora phaffii (strain ATCC 24235 / CBS 4417 / NBRC 1672 / NRRL Y-8282 / UCD 70-5) TaxID=1071381 RepID=G8BP49_TETPH|nr:hypothetical protein TPHA_0A06030 [Tetrapisispora phaffii CBS 4417]CCE61677.1 hypothetical protein TPHA_0A06030 [Tetrapisispora phaffii CBS 4417]